MRRRTDGLAPDSLCCGDMKTNSALQWQFLPIFSLEHGRFAYYADFALYALAVLGLGGLLAYAAPHGQGLVMLAYLGLGMFIWSFAEYLLHRFVLHGLQPFCRWHAAHHQRPRALISTPTLLSAALIILLVFLPALALGELWRATALTLGVLTGYLAYAITHHATHHLRAGNRWLRRRKHWHALHHRRAGRPGFYGVTSGFWDYVFGSTPFPPPLVTEAPVPISTGERA